jgi:hypothetical protein
VEGDDLADEDGGEGLGGLLVAKGGGCNLDTGACDSMANQREEVPTMDTCKPVRRRLRRVGRGRCSSGRHPRHDR